MGLLAESSVHAADTTLSVPLWNFLGHYIRVLGPQIKWWSFSVVVFTHLIVSHYFLPNTTFFFDDYFHY